MLAEIFQPIHWQWEAAFQLVLSGFLGAAIGLERQVHGRAAGFRTHLLVCTGCCLVMLVSHNFARAYAELYTDDANVIRVDPARLAYSVMAGIGFMGAGAIIKSGFSVRGLTTAACLWCAASIGLAVGSGLYFLSLLTTGIVIAALLMLSKMEGLLGSYWYKKVTVVCSDLPEEIEAVEKLLESHAVKVLDVSFQRDLDANTLRISYSVRLPNRQLTPMIYKALAGYKGLHRISVD